jgi:hypothetical protein
MRGRKFCLFVNETCLGLATEERVHEVEEAVIAKSDGAQTKLLFRAYLDEKPR